MVRRSGEAVGVWDGAVRGEAGDLAACLEFEQALLGGPHHHCVEGHQAFHGAGSETGPLALQRGTTQEGVAGVEQPAVPGGHCDPRVSPAVAQELHQPQSFDEVVQLVQRRRDELSKLSEWVSRPLPDVDLSTLRGGENTPTAAGFVSLDDFLADFLADGATRGE